MLQKEIPIYSLNTTTQRGWIIDKYSKYDNSDLIFKGVHRDDHYIFIFQQKGKSRIMLDFDIVDINGCAVFCILPGQAHQGIFAENVEAWFLAVDPEILQDSFRHFFMEQITPSRLVHFNYNNSTILLQIMLLLDNLCSQPNDESSEEIKRSLIDASIGVIVREFKMLTKPEHLSLSRPTIITREFKSLLLRSFKTIKAPSDYAKSLNISPSYLNEVVKNTTGFSVSYWINQEVILEAKRILFYTDCSIKEIAEQLGYDDHSYFTRVFTKFSGISPIAFRQSYRESS